MCAHTSKCEQAGCLLTPLLKHVIFKLWGDFKKGEAGSDSQLGHWPGKASATGGPGL